MGGTPLSRNPFAFSSPAGNPQTPSTPSNASVQSQIDSAGLNQSDPARAAYLGGQAGGGINTIQPVPNPSPTASPSTPGGPVGGVGGAPPGAPPSAAVAGLQSAMAPQSGGGGVGFQSAIQGLRQGIGQRSMPQMSNELSQRPRVY